MAGLPKARTVLWQLTQRGFGSEVNALLFGLLFAQATGRRFVLCSRFWNASVDRGWEDYFQPFTEECRWAILRRHYIHRSISWRGNLVQAAQRLWIWPRYGRVLLPHEALYLVWSEEFATGRIVPLAGGDSYAGCQALLHSIWRLRPEVAEEVDALHAPLGLRDGRHITVHIRRGDKTEGERIPVEGYVRRAREVAPGPQVCFLMTDDHAVVNEVASLAPEWEIVTAARPTDRGHDQGAFNAMPAAARRAAIVRLIAEIELARAGQCYVGTFSSNLGRLVALLRGRETTYGADFPYRVIF